MEIGELLAVAGLLLGITALFSAFARLLSSFNRRLWLRIFGRSINIDLEDYGKGVDELEAVIEARQESPHVVVSYAYEDSSFAKRLAGDLRTLGITVWLPEEELQPGDDILSTVKDEIADSQWVINVITPASVKSRWVSKEVSAALKTEKERGRALVIPILLRGSAPETMSARLYADFRTNYDEGFSKLISRLQPAGGTERGAPG